MYTELSYALGDKFLRGKQVSRTVLLLTTCSSFDEYSTEVKSGRLSWSPVHKSEKFWVRHFAMYHRRWSRGVWGVCRHPTIEPFF